MAKILPGIINISGKINDKVLVHTKHGTHVRMAVAPGSKKNEPGLRNQNSRNLSLNKLAAEINHIITGYAGHYKSNRFYPTLLKRFRKEPENNRFLLLMQLKGMDIHPEYPMSRLGGARINTKTIKDEICITLEVEFHPQPIENADCYFYEVILLTWGKSQNAALSASQLSDWIYLKDGKPEFEFLFPKPADARHWLLFLRQRLGIAERLKLTMPTDSTQVVDAGSFDKKEQELWAGKQAALLDKIKGNNTGKPVEEILRVKAKRVS